MKTLLTNGDSWAFGSEIAGPHMLVPAGEKGEGMTQNFKAGMLDCQPHNDYYRVPRIWSTHLANKLGYKSVNISWPARSNDTIFNSTMGWVMKYLSEGGDPAELVVVVGWSSLERKNILIEGFDDKLHQYTIWPAMIQDEYYKLDVMKRFSKFYIQHLWNEREAITRFVEQNFQLHTYLKSNAIQHVFFNSFYVPNMPKGKLSPLNDWRPCDLSLVINNWHAEPFDGWLDGAWNNRQDINRIRAQWKSIPDDVFLDKLDFRSFKSFIDENVPKPIRMINMHPSPESHEAWANHLYERKFK